MIELSIEEKAKRYDEAIEKANSLWHYKNQPCIINISEIFPELKENKDERIKKALISVLKSDFENDTTINNIRVGDIIAWVEKQNNTDKVEPDFEIIKDKWYVCTYTTCTEDSRIWFRKDVAYLGKDILRYNLGFEPKDYQKCFRLWTIEDAKDGDVLCTYECDKPKIVFILKGTPKKHCALCYHCYYNIIYPYFEPDSKAGCLVPNEEDVKPATKEQYNLLFIKIKEAGYELDTDKRVLNKIIEINKTQTSKYCYILNYNTGKIFKHIITEDEVDLTTEELLKKYGLNEDECSIMYASNNLELELLEN